MFVQATILHEQNQAILRQAIEQHIFPGAVVALSQDGHMLDLQALGTTAYDAPESRPVQQDTIYDIASLTKLVTATAALRLIEQGRIDLHADLRYFLPKLAMRQVTIWHLLTHSSGIDLRLSTLAQHGVSILKKSIHEVQPRYTPGTVAAYTNINSLLLGEVVAKVYGAGLDQALAELVLQPLGMRETRFCPPVALHSRIAPTEVDQILGRGTVHGVVHDESAYVLGGIAGHAGLFSTVGDLLRFCHAWLGLEPYQAFLSPETRRLAFEDHSPHLTLSCGLGWMLKRPAFMGPAVNDAVAHTGFTGPVLVLLPKLSLALIMLSNRTYPQRSTPTHHTVTACLLEHLLHQYTNDQNML